MSRPGRYLADLGAEVLRVEPPGGSPSRRAAPLAADGTSLTFAIRSINKAGPDQPTSSWRSGACCPAPACPALVAYSNRLDTGRGEVVDFSVLEAVTQVLDPGYGISGSARAGQTVGDLPRGRPDARHLYPIFRCADGWVRICVLSPRQWQGMWRWLGEPERFADPRYGDLGVRFAAAGELYPMIGQMFAGRTRDTIVAESVEFGVPAAALLDAADVVVGEHSRTPAGRG